MYIHTCTYVFVHINRKPNNNIIISVLLSLFNTCRISKIHARIHDEISTPPSCKSIVIVVSMVDCWFWSWIEKSVTLDLWSLNFCFSLLFYFCIFVFLSLSLLSSELHTSSENFFSIVPLLVCSNICCCCPVSFFCWSKCQLLLISLSLPRKWHKTGLKGNEKKMDSYWETETKLNINDHMAICEQFQRNVASYLHILLIMQKKEEKTHSRRIKPTCTQNLLNRLTSSFHIRIKKKKKKISCVSHKRILPI